jgi:hypothetical protein
MIIAENGRDLGLLKHKLGHKNLVWIGRLTPG